MVGRTHISDGQPIRQTQPPQSQVAGKRLAQQPFDAVIRKEIEKLKGVKFSAHALQRLDARKIQLSAGDTARIVEAIDRAASKGAKDSLVLVGGAAMVVSVKNRTVVTVLDRDELRGNVFTNIDSAIVMDGDYTKM